MTPSAKRRLQVLVIIAGLHIIAVSLYFAFAPRPDHPSKYGGGNLGDGIVGGFVFPLFALLGGSLLDLLPDSDAVAAAMFALNSLVWAMLVIFVVYLCRTTFAAYRARRNI